MKIGSISENKELEKRISVTPEIAKKYIGLGLEVYLGLNYGSHLGFNGEEYKNVGVNFLKDELEIINKSEIIIQLGLPSEEKLSTLNENQTLIGVLN